VEDKEKILSEPLEEASLFFPEARRLTSYYCKEYHRSETEYPERRLLFCLVLIKYIGNLVD